MRDTVTPEKGEPPSVDNGPLLSKPKEIVGARHVLTAPSATRPFRKGYRFGDGPALAVVRPGTLLEQWHVLKACAADEKIVIMQAANTGLTGGSTPDGDDYDCENRFEHHLILKISKFSVKKTRFYLAFIFPSEYGAYFECSSNEGEKAFQHCFAAAGAAVRYRAIHRSEVADNNVLDVALPRNERNWFERLPGSSISSIAGTSSAKCSTKITSLRKDIIQRRSSMRCGASMTGDARDHGS